MMYFLFISNIILTALLGYFFMATKEQFEQAIERINAAILNIAEDIRGLKDKLSNVGLPSDVEDEVLSLIEAKATQLESLAGETPEEETEETEE